MGDCIKKDTTGLYLEIYGDWMRDTRYFCEVLIFFSKIFFEGGQMLKQIVQSGCEISVFEDTKNFTRQVFQPGTVLPYFKQGYWTK